MIEYTRKGNEVYARFSGDEPDGYQIVNGIFKDEHISVQMKDRLGKYADELTRGGLVGVAKCHPYDEFDIEKGKKLARYRLLKKYYFKKKKVYDRLIDTILDISCRDLEKYRDVRNHCSYMWRKCGDEELDMRDDW